QGPLYWQQKDGVWTEFTLSGQVDLQPSLPVCHVSYFEADAFARWAGARLATEAEWEVASEDTPEEGNFATSLMDSGAAIHPNDNASTTSDLRHLYGNVWEWTSSSYAPYPGYEAPAGALGEYNGKFMCNQYVLRGGSCATPVGHVRRTYRNFFPPESRWQFSGVRLAR
ncbi:MAG: SUMF1/EgtB/PvdO family nonheme iron enzyme, partial [Fuerstiella sp.]|nr:SUMF1/EgtB/PvdO family nonheme iron enzyme [Fuerstiella sp.]